jgi:hypothetical protein
LAVLVVLGAGVVAVEQRGDLDQLQRQVAGLERQIAGTDTKRQAEQERLDSKLAGLGGRLAMLERDADSLWVPERRS